MSSNKNTKGCIKCGYHEAEVYEIAATGTGLSKFFDVQKNHFKVVSCKKCGYSELYRTNANMNVLDFFFGG